MVATAMSSPLEPETMMNGTSKSLARAMRSASRPLKRGML